MNNAQEKFLQAVKETICILDEHQYDGGEVTIKHFDEYKTTCFSFRCYRCGKYVTYAIRDSDLCYTYPIEMKLEFDNKENTKWPNFIR